MAIYYFRNAGTNWGDATNWSLTDGGGADGAVPTSADDAYFTSNSGNCTVDTSARVCKTLIFSGVGSGNYSNTFTVDQQITVSGNVTLSATMTVSGNARLRINATATLTSNGTTWSGGLTIVTNLTITFGSSWTVAGSFDTTNTTGTVTLNNNTLTIGGSFTSIITTGNVGGTTNIVLNGTGTLATNGSTGGSIQNNLTINTTGTITIGTQLSYTTGTLTYTTGTVVTTGSTLRLSGASTLATDGIVWNNILFPSLAIQPTINLSNNLTCSGNFTANNLATSLTLNGGTFTIGGSFTANNMTTGAILGTTDIILNGTGTLSSNNATEGSIRNNITINTTGTITLGTRLSYSVGTFTYTTGTVVTTGNILRTLGNCTFATDGMTWNTITFGQFVTTQNQTITLTNPLSCINVTSNNTSGGVTLTGSTLTVSGNFTANTITTGSIGGTTNILLNGTGTLSTNAATTGAVISNLTINTSGTITFGTVFSYGTRTFTYTSGTVATSGNTLRLQASCSLNLDGINFNAIATNGSATYTLTSDLTAVSLTIPTGTTTTMNGQTCYLTSFSGGTTVHGGTTVMYFNGWSGNGTFTSGSWNFQTLTIDTPNTFTISSLSTGIPSLTRNITQIQGAVRVGTLITTVGTNNLTFLSNTIINTLQITRAVNTTNLINDLYVVTLQFSGSNTNMNSVALNGTGKKVYVSGNVNIVNATDIGGLTGTATIEMVGTGTLLNVVNIVPTGVFNIPVTINTDGIITIPTSNMPQLNNVFRFVKGNIARNNATITFRNNIFGANKSNFDSVAILGGASITMDEFFNGRPNRPCIVRSTSSTNYTINFQNGLEKFARFVKIGNATISRRDQLTVLTQEGNNGNNIGVKFAQNQLANGLSKNNPSVNQFTAYGVAGLPEDVTLS